VDVANWFWSDGPAPWETVDPIYYPNKNDLTVYEAGGSMESLGDCRAWVYAEAIKRGDPMLERGDYECGVGYLRSFGSLGVYRMTLR